MSGTLQNKAASFVLQPIQKGVLKLCVWLLNRTLGKFPFRPVIYCRRHRLNAREEFYEKAFDSRKNVFMLSIMCQTTLKEDMLNLLNRAKECHTHVKVLTWEPSDDEHIEPFRRHLNENAHDPDRTVTQVREAVKDWKYLQSQFPEVLEVRSYKSSPTMQGILVEGDWALIELIPYDTKPRDRPALIIGRRSNPEELNFVEESVKRLWDQSTRLMPTPSEASLQIPILA